MEASSLYLRCTLTPTQYQAAMAAPAAGAGEFDDWQQWLDSKEVYGSGVFSKADLEGGDGAPLGALLEAWSDSMHGGLFHYDEARGIFQFALMEFTDNYGEMLQLLAPLRKMAQYAQADADSFLLIYPYIWGGDIDAFMTLDQQRSTFAAVPSEQQRAEADAVFQGMLDNFQEPDYPFGEPS